MEIESGHGRATRTRHRRETVSVDLVSAKRGNAVSGVGPCGDPAAHRSGIQGRQTGVVFRERVRSVLQPAALDQGGKIG